MSRLNPFILPVALQLFLGLASLCPNILGQEQFFGSDNMNPMEHGPFVSSTITLDPLSPRGILVHKGIAVRVGKDSEAVMVFDTDLLRVAGAWTGGFLNWYPARDGLQEWPSPAGFMHFATSRRPGWGAKGGLQDPRPWPYGPLPKEWGRYNGLYLNGDQVVFSYAVGGAEVLELYGFERLQGRPVFTRTLNLGPVATAHSLLLMQIPVGRAVSVERKVESDSSGFIRIRAGSESRMIGFQGLPLEAEWRLLDHHLILDLPVRDEPLRFRLAIGPVLSDPQVEYMVDYLRHDSGVADLSDLTKAGPARWEVLKTQSQAGSEEGPFAVDVLTVPARNPWNSHLRFSDVDFLSDGRAVLTSLSGDVWLVSGLEETAGTLRWQRFATGLNQPLGIRVVQDRIYVTGRDQITLLHDRNGNGEADYYENFNNEVMAATNFHAFTMNLETDSKGDFYFAKATPWPTVRLGVPAEITPHHGVLFRLPPEGNPLEVVATGLRNPNGMAIGPRDEIIYADNEGNWIPTSFVQRIRKGRFHGFVPSAHLDRPPRDEDFEKPIVWLPHFVDNSPAKPKFIRNQSWPAELQGHLLLVSYGRGTLSLILLEEVDGQWQGGHLVLPLEFRSGLERARFHRDGHLYIAGLTSWQSVGHGGDWASFHRVRLTGRPLHLPVALNTKAGGLQMSFSDALDPKTATDVNNYRIQQWTYPWTSLYGTRGRLYSVKRPGEIGADPVEIRAIQLSADRRSVFLEIPELKPGPVDTRIPLLEALPDQIEASLGLILAIQYRLVAEDGERLEHVIHKTIHRVSDEPIEPGFQ